jgi:hypothetical protein
MSHRLLFISRRLGVRVLKAFLLKPCASVGMPQSLTIALIELEPTIGFLSKFVKLNIQNLQFVKNRNS